MACGSLWPVKITSAVRGGKALCKVVKRELMVAWSEASSAEPIGSLTGGFDDDFPATALVG